MSVYVRPFKKEDLKAFKSIEPDMQEFSPELAQAIEDSDLAVTGIRDGEIVGCGGVHPDGEHGEMWLRLSKTCMDYKIDTLRWLISGLKVIEEIVPFRQLNATIKDDFRDSIKLINHLGFRWTQSLTAEGRKWHIFSKRLIE